MKNVYELSDDLNIFDVNKLFSLLPKEFTSNSFDVEHEQEITKCLELHTEQEDQHFAFLLKLTLTQSEKDSNKFHFDTDMILAKNKAGLPEYMLAYAKPFLPSLENFFIELHKQIHAFQKQMDAYDISFEMENGISSQLQDIQNLSEDEEAFFTLLSSVFENNILPMIEPEIQKHVQTVKEKLEQEKQDFDKEMDQFLANNMVTNTENEIEKVKKEIDKALDSGDKERFLELHKELQVLTEKENAQ